MAGSVPVGLGGQAIPLGLQRGEEVAERELVALGARRKDTLFVLIRALALLLTDLLRIPQLPFYY